MKSDNPKISVIVPVYNTEKYLRRCIDSILNQTFIDFEVLLINDGSTDSSGTICDDYAKKDNRVRVFHKENGGVSSARNIGIKKCSGDWICFVDSDDRIHLNLFFVLMEKVQKYNFDVFCFEGVREKNNENIRGIITSGLYEDVENYIQYNRHRRELWVHIFKKDLIINNQISFRQSLRYAEDLEFTTKCFIMSEGFFSLSFVGYYYNDLNTSSVTTFTPTVSDVVSHFSVIDSIISFAEEKEINNKYFTNSIYFFFVASVFFLMKLPNKKIIKKHGVYKETYNRNKNKVELSYSKKIKLALLNNNWFFRVFVFLKK